MQPCFSFLTEYQLVQHHVSSVRPSAPLAAAALCSPDQGSLEWHRANLKI